MIYTANTREGASCIAMVSTPDFRQWQDHRPICIGPTAEYEARLEGDHPQGSLESANLLHRRNKWHLLVKAKVRDSRPRLWVVNWTDLHPTARFLSSGEELAALQARP